LGKQLQCTFIGRIVRKFIGLFRTTFVCYGRLDEIVCKLGERRMSVSGLIENLARHYLETYGDDIERWRKL
jgi:hypothetical protein